MRKADLGVIEVEDGVVVPHPGVAQDPELAPNAGVGHDAAHAVARPVGRRPKVERGGRQGEILAADGEADVWRGGRARERVEACAQGGRRVGRAGDLRIEVLHSLRISNDEGGSLFIDRISIIYRRREKENRRRTESTMAAVDSKTVESATLRASNWICQYPC